MFGKTNAGGGGGGGEVHGCTIVAITNREDCIGLPATLSFNGAVIQTKLIGSDLSIVFDAVQTDGEYAIDTENVEGDAVHANVTVTARNVLDTATLTVSVDMDTQTVNYLMLLDNTSGFINECIDITGGWELRTVTGTASSIEIRRTNGYIELKYPSGVDKNYEGYWCTKNKVTSMGYKAVYAQSGVSPKKNDYTAVYSGWGDNVPPTTKVLKTFAGNGVNNPEIISPEKTIDTNLISPFLYFYKNSSGDNLYIRFRNMFLVKSDNWQELMNKAEISVSSLDAFFSSDTSIQKLLGNEEAVSYMIQKCTGDFMVQAIQNQTFKSMLNSCPYREQIWDNEHWQKFLRIGGYYPIDKRIYLYKDGNECIDMTNGWAIHQIPYVSVTKESSDIKFVTSGLGSWHNGYAITTKTLTIGSVTYSRLGVEMEHSGNGNYYVGVGFLPKSKSVPSTGYPTIDTYPVLISQGWTETSVNSFSGEVTNSAVNLPVGEYYMVMVMSLGGSYSNAKTLKVKKVWLEK